MDCDNECGNVHDKGTQGNQFRKCNHTTYPLSIRQRAEKKSALWLRGPPPYSSTFVSIQHNCPQSNRFPQKGLRIPPEPPFYAFFVRILCLQVLDGGSEVHILGELGIHLGLILAAGEDVDLDLRLGAGGTDDEGSE